MKITFLGTGVAIPQPDRVQSGMIIEMDSKPILFDCGSGVLNRIFESNYDHTDIDTIVLSHLHLDHVADVLCLIKANWLCDKTDVTIYGPKGTQQWISMLLEVYDYMQGKVPVHRVYTVYPHLATGFSPAAQQSCTPGTLNHVSLLWTCAAMLMF
jgi:ribonuclease BN (tRNA processing enzyme)